MKTSRNLVKTWTQANLGQIISIHLLVWLMSVGFAFGQTADQRKLELIVQTGHSDLVKSIAFSPDGKTFASGSIDWTIRLWNVETGQQIKSLAGHVGSVNSVIFSPNGKTLISGGDDKTIRLWNVETGQQIKSLAGHVGSVDSVAFSPDGKTLAAGNYISIKLWNLETGQSIKDLKEDYGVSPNSVTFSPDGKTIVSGNRVGIVKFWNVKTGQLIKSLKVQYSSDVKMALSPDGKTLASGDYDNTIKFWNVETGQLVKSLAGHAGWVRSVAFSPDGKVLASASEDKTIRLWNLETGQQIESLEGQAYWETVVTFSPNGNILASVSGRTVKLWNIKSGQLIKSLSGYINFSKSIVFSPDGKTLVSGTLSDTIKLWNIQTGQLTKSLEGHADRIDSVIFSPDGKTLASGSMDRTVKLWNIETGRQINSLELEFETEGRPSVAFSPDGKILASEDSYNIKLWNVETGQLVKSLEDNAGGITSIAFSSDGKTLASGNYEDETIKLWNVETGQMIKSLEGHADWIFSVAFSPDGKTLASGSRDNTIKLWSVENGQLTKSLEGHNGAVTSVAFSPDGKTIASGSGDETIKLWNVQKGKQVASLDGHANFVWSVAFSSDGKTLSSVGGDGTVKLWDIQRSKALGTLISLDNTDWVVIDENMRFDASEGALKLMHYSYGLEVINLEQLKEMYYEPGLLQKLLGFSKETLRTIVPLKDIKLYPEIVEQNFDEKTGKLNIKLKNRGGGIGRTEVFVNDKRVVEDARDEKLQKNPLIALEGVVDLTVQLPASAFVKGANNEIKVITSNYLKEIGKGNIQSRGTGVFYLDKNKAETELPNLYAIVGGVSDYDGEQLDLNFAAKDAEDFSNALRLGANRLFCPSQNTDCLNKINITTLSTARENPQEQPTKENFKKAFAEIAAKAKPEDILVVYLSGHGVTLGTGTDTYFYLTKEARSASREDLGKTFQTAAISNEELTDWLTPNDKNPNDIWVNTGKQVIILDTCAAGNFAEKDWKKDKDLSGDQIRAMDFLSGKTGTFILMGSAANRPSYEANRYNQGLLTFALLEGMKGSALQPATGNIDVGLLFDYATNRVPNLAKEMSLDQNPIIKRPSGNPFVFGQMSEAEKKLINLPMLKPILLRPLLTNPETGDDDLRLIPALRKLLDTESSYEVMKRSGKGEPLMIYIDDDSFPGAVRVTGTYTVDGENVRVKAFLRQDGKTIANFEIVATKDKIADEIMNAVRTELAKLK